MIADVVMASHGLDKLVTDVLRMIGGETDPKGRIDQGDRLQKIGEVHLPLAICPKIGVHILAKQRDLFVPSREHFSRH